MLATETARGAEDKMTIFFNLNYRRNVLSAHMLEMPLLGVGAVLRLERDAWSMAKQLRLVTSEYAPPSPPALL